MTTVSFPLISISRNIPSTIYESKRIPRRWTKRKIFLANILTMFSRDLWCIQVMLIVVITIHLFKTGRLTNGTSLMTPLFVTLILLTWLRRLLGVRLVVTILERR